METAPEDERQKALEGRLAQIDEINSSWPPMSSAELALRYERDEELIRLLKELRGSVCQVCGATFRMRNGDSYSEAHHLEHLAESGLDVSSNIVILCAQHHRQFHYGEVEKIVHTQDEVSVRIEGVVHRCSLR